MIPLRLIAGALACAALTLNSPAWAEDSLTRPSATLPDWGGIWFVEGAVPEITGFVPPDAPPPYKLLDPEAPWNPEGLKRVAVAQAQPARKAPGWGYPMMMAGSAPLQFLISPRETLIVNLYRDIRHIYTDGRSLPTEEDRWPTVWGESIGRWEGETLVIETVAVEEPQKYFFATPPLSADARYIERIRMVSPDRIESEMTIEDPVTMLRPWTVKLAYTRAEGLDRLVHDAFVNDRSELDGDTFGILPPSDSGG